MSTPISGRGIHIDPNFGNYEFQWSLLMIGTIVFCSFYFIPTGVVVWRILMRYAKSTTDGFHSLPQPIFFALVAILVSNTFAIITNILHFRLPSTGVLTAWCATHSPSALLMILYVFHWCTVYSARLFTVLFCAIRLLVVVKPNDISTAYGHAIIKRSFGFIILLSIGLNLCMIQYDGICAPLPPPFLYGTVVITIDTSEYANVIISYSLSLVCFAVSLILVGATIWRTRHTFFIWNNPLPSFRAETSLTLTTITLLPPLLFDILHVATEIANLSYNGHVIIAKEIFCDFAIILTPWVLYLTHPLFRKSRVPNAQISMSTLSLEVREHY